MHSFKIHLLNHISFMVVLLGCLNFLFFFTFHSTTSLKNGQYHVKLECDDSLMTLQDVALLPSMADKTITYDYSLALADYSLDRAIY